MDDFGAPAPSDVNLLAARIHSLHSDVNDIKGTLRDLTNAITKLALVEERLTNTMAAQERAFKAIANIEQWAKANSWSAVTAEHIKGRPLCPEFTGVQLGRRRGAAE